jgi:glycosyltransferase involved in cell wall biosynthesis
MEWAKIFLRALTAEKFHKGTFYVLKTGFLRTQKETSHYVDMFLPNSLSEWKRYEADVAIDGAPYRIIPNAVDQFLFDPAQVRMDPAYDRFKGCVLCVARIDGRKNQYRLAEAMEDVPAKLVLVGKASDHHLKDLKKIKSRNHQNVYLLGEIPHDKLPPLYAAAKVHALPSFFETTGLSSLEAGIMDCNIVVGSGGDQREYFGDLAYYCQPDSVDSIRQAVLKAINSPVNPKLGFLICQNLTWEITAQKTLAAYEDVLNFLPE